MAKSQRQPLSPPNISDRERLTDYTGKIQDSLKELFNSAHDHIVFKATPGKNDGSIQQISIVDTGTSVTLVVKTSRGWFQSNAFTAI